MPVAIGVPARTDVCIFTVHDLVALVKKTTVDNTLFAVWSGSIIAESRNELAKIAVEQNCSHLLFVDSDMRLPPHTIDLLVSRDKPIIGANCLFRRDASQWTTGISSAGRTGIERVSKIGCGVTLIRRDVLEGLPKPWFATPYDEKNERFCSEDIYFCVKAKACGFSIWTDHDLSQDVRHISTKELAVSDWAAPE